MYGLVGIRFDDIHENYFDKDTNVRLFVNVLTQRNWIESVISDDGNPGPNFCVN